MRFNLILAEALTLNYLMAARTLIILFYRHRQRDYEVKVSMYEGKFTQGKQR